VLNKDVYCFTREFLGSVKMDTNSWSFKACKEARIGIRPSNSGIRPYVCRSAGVTEERILDDRVFLECEERGGEELKPRVGVLVERREAIIFSSPIKAPANTKRIWEVSMVYCSAFPLPPPFPDGSLLFWFRDEEEEEDLSDLECTVTVVPSIIFNKPCWTPSPETSRPCVMMAGLASLSTSSKKMIPVSHKGMEWLDASKRRSMEDSMSVPM